MIVINVTNCYTIVITIHFAKVLKFGITYGDRSVIGRLALNNYIHDCNVGAESIGVTRWILCISGDEFHIASEHSNCAAESLTFNNST